MSQVAILRLGFICGERDGTVIPKLQQAVFLVMESKNSAGHVFNLTQFLFLRHSKPFHLGSACG